MDKRIFSKKQDSNQYEGVFFLFSSWSGESRLMLKIIQSKMLNYPKLTLTILDTDTEVYKEFQNRMDIISHGKGEIFWITKREILAKIDDYSKTIKILEIERFITENNKKLKDLLNPMPEE